MKQISTSENTGKARPFLKWAGGKSQLIPEILSSLPFDRGNKNIIYIEPFIGSGAVLFNFLNSFTNISRAVINDFNTDLTNTYSSIKNSPEKLIESLSSLEAEYKTLSTEASQREYFLNIRGLFNSRAESIIQQSAYFIFLNKTCFNGLFRVNSKNAFNVPFGKYKNPTICDKENLLNVSKALRPVEILNGDYSATLSYASSESFYYLDPPYKPISETASFNSYAKKNFDDAEQHRLKDFCDALNSKGAKWLLSNSDLKNIDPDNHFFDELYKEYHIRRVKAKRAINSVGSSRGEIFELLISNY